MQSFDYQPLQTVSRLLVGVGRRVKVAAKPPRKKFCANMMQLFIGKSQKFFRSLDATVKPIRKIDNKAEGFHAFGSYMPKENRHGWQAAAV